MLGFRIHMPALLHRITTSFRAAVQRLQRRLASSEANRASANQLATEVDENSSIELGRQAWRDQCLQASLRIQKNLRDRHEAELTRFSNVQVERPFDTQPDEDQPERPRRGESFYGSRRWQTIRYEAFLRYGRQCALCGRTSRKSGVILHVDHIKPRFTHSELQWDIRNLQILCEDCNLGKGARDSTKWR